MIGLPEKARPVCYRLIWERKTMAGKALEHFRKLSNARNTHFGLAFDSSTKMIMCPRMIILVGLSEQSFCEMIILIIPE